MPKLRSTRAFSTVELLVVLLIMGIVSSQVLGMFASQLQVAHAHSRRLDAQEDVRLVSDMVLTSVRMAGFMTPTIAGLSSVDGGNNAPDILCTSDPDVLDDDRVDDATDRFDRAGLTADVGAGDTSVDLVVAEMDIDSDGDVDFSVNQGIIITDGAKTHCARITGVAGGTVSFQPAAAAVVATAGGRAVPALVYELTGNGMLRNGVLLSTQVEDLQVEFGVDANNDGDIGAGEFPIHDLNASNPSRTRTVRLSVMTRTRIEDVKLPPTSRRALGNRDAAAVTDRFGRRVISVTAAPRNLL